MASMPREAATPTPMATAAMSRMMMMAIALPNPVEPNSVPEASACNGKTLSFHAVASSPNPTAWA